MVGRLKNIFFHVKQYVLDNVSSIDLWNFEKHNFSILVQNMNKARLHFLVVSLSICTVAMDSRDAEISIMGSLIWFIQCIFCFATAWAVGTGFSL